MYKGKTADLVDYPVLNFNSYGRVYFYGCHIAQGTDAVQAFADKQHVVTFATQYAASFSMSTVHEFDVIELPPEPLMRESERPQMGDVYLKSYVFPEIGMPWSDMPVQGGYSDWEA